MTTNISGKHKLDYEHKKFIFNNLACGMPVYMVHQMLKEVFPDHHGCQTVTYQNIKYYNDHHKQKIADIKARIVDNMETIPIARKEFRLNQLQIIVGEGMKWFVKSVNMHGEVEARDISAVLAALRQAQHEMEPFKIAPTTPDGKEQYQPLPTQDKEAMSELAGQIDAIINPKPNGRAITAPGSNGHTDAVDTASEE